MTTRLWTIPVLAGLLTLALCGVGFAMPSLGGPTGIVSVPNAYVAPMKSLDLALSYQKAKMALNEVTNPSGESTSEVEDLTVWSLQALTGVAEQAELWAAYSAVRDGNDSHIWGLGGKVALTKEPQEDATLAIGGSYRKWVEAFTESILETGGMYSSVSSDAKVWDAYIVASKDFTPLKGEKWEWGPGGGTRMIGSAGLMYKKVDVTDFSESLTRPFLGVQFIGAAGTSLGLEYRWKDDTLDEKAVFSAVLQHKFSAEVTAELGTTNASPIGTGLNDQNVFVRVGYSFPMKGY